MARPATRWTVSLSRQTRFRPKSDDELESGGTRRVGPREVVLRAEGALILRIQMGHLSPQWIRSIDRTSSTDGRDENHERETIARGRKEEREFAHLIINYAAPTARPDNRHKRTHAQTLLFRQKKAREARPPGGQQPSDRPWQWRHRRCRRP